jgi:predicted O-linked N-acetylglucosamine transferase (SPINDLY family)
MSFLRDTHPLTIMAYTDDPLFQLASAEHFAWQFDPPDCSSGNADRRGASIAVNTRRLRIGYVSSDLRDHAIGYLMAELFELHDNDRFEIFAYCSGPENIGMLGSRIRSAIEHWVDIRSLTDEQAAQQIADDQIDVLIDVNGHTSNARTGVFARHPAPVQVNWLGYPGTMGTPYHQYIIADRWIIPPESEIYYSEKVVRLPCYQPNDRKRMIASERPDRHSVGLPENAFVYCCFNGTQKISRFSFGRWLETLRCVPDSVLWLLDTAEETKRCLGELAEQGGVDPTRLIYAPKLQNAFHLARYPLADLFLDTAPYGAHTTGSDALWMGVPVLTLSGRSFASRVCGSLVRAAGLGGLVCETPEAYVERAVSLGLNRAEVEAYKQELVENRSACKLFDMPMLARQLEQLYFGMCVDHNQGRAPHPDLTNLPAYLEAAIRFDHENQEMLATKSYHAMYMEKLALLNKMRPLHVDRRLWSGDCAASPSPRRHDLTARATAPSRSKYMLSANFFTE